MRGPFVDQVWLSKHLQDVRVLDVRWYLGRPRAGYEAFLDGHIPGALHVDVERVLSAPPAGAMGGRHPLPDVGVFGHRMAELGIDDKDVVVAYDDSGGTVAGRLVWMLRVLGHEAMLLDGGLATWTGELDGGPASRPMRAGSFGAENWPIQRVISLQDVAETRRLIVDARAPMRFRGEEELVDSRAGHIPGAVNIPATCNLTVDGTLRSLAEIRQMYEQHGVTRDGEVVVHCGSGVTACLTMLALEAAGFRGGRLFVGSWSQWSADANRPAATGRDGAALLSAAEQRNRNP